MSEKPGIELLKNTARRFKAFLFSKDALTFLFFLFLSAAFWFSNSVNKVRDANITIPLRYNSLPNEFTITNNPPSEIRLSVRDEGLNLLSYSRRRSVPLNIDLSKIDGDKEEDFKLSSDQILSRLSYYLYPTTSVLGFSPDSIYVQFQKLDEVTLPVRLNMNIELAQQYIFSDSIRIVPAYVTAYGSKDALAGLTELQTEYMDLKQVKDTVAIKSRLIPIQSVNFSADEVEVTVGVEMFTEKKLQLPVVFINVPDDLSVRAFPAVVDVTYNIGLSHYNTTHDDIQVVVDYNDIVENNHPQQKIKVVNNSSKIFNVRVVPEEVEFILEEQ